LGLARFAVCLNRHPGETGLCRPEFFQQVQFLCMLKDLVALLWAALLVGITMNAA
jgi:hypothetical protein